MINIVSDLSSVQVIVGTEKRYLDHNSFLFALKIHKLIFDPLAKMDQKYLNIKNLNQNVDCSIYSCGTLP